MSYKTGSTISSRWTSPNAASTPRSTRTPQSTAFKDVYVQMRDLPVLGNVRVGHFKECFGLEQLTSDNYITFMGRFCDEGTFVPGRNDGIMAFNWTENQRVTWAVGEFANDTGYDQPPTFQFDHGGADCTERRHFSSLVRKASGGRGLLHTGCGYAFRDAPNRQGIFAIRDEAAFGPSVINMTTKSNMRDRRHLAGLRFGIRLQIRAVLLPVGVVRHDHESPEQRDR